MIDSHVVIDCKLPKLSAYLLELGSDRPLKYPEITFHALSAGPLPVVGANSVTTLFLDFRLFLKPGFTACASLMNLFSNSSETVYAPILSKWLAI